MENAEVITTDGEVLEQGALTVLSGGLVTELSKAEIAQQVATAHQFPRSITKASRNINSLATLDEEAAADCIYALPRGGKPIRGPSIRLAEIVAQSWGNNRVATRVIEIDRTEKVIVAEAVFHDLETNAAVKATVRRRISDRQGRILNEDMIVVTGNAASSIARRNAILAGVPKAVWNRAYNAAEGVVKGDVKTLAERRAKAISAFGTWGVKPEQIFAVLGAAGEEEITLDHIPTLIGMFQAIKNGEESVESLFTARAPGKVFDKVANPLDDGAGAKKPAPGAAPATATSGPATALTAAPTNKDPDASGFGETQGTSGEGAGAPARETPAAGSKPRGHSAAEAQADRIVTADGEVVKDRDGPAADERSPRDVARERGAQAYRQGRSKKAAPAEYHGDDNAELLDAWLDGHEDARTEAGS